MDKIVKFSGLLREKGIPASVRSTQTAIEAYKLLKKDSKENEDVLRDALAAIYLKDRRQFPTFEKTFDSLFRPGEPDSTKESEEEITNSSKKRYNSKRFLKAYNYSFKVLEPEKVEAEKSALDGFDYMPPLDENLKNEFDESELLQRDITKLNSFEPELLDLCQKLGRKIANKRARRRNESRNMRPDIRRTMRKNLKYGGTLIDLVRSKPKIKKNEHIFLNDVSGSCDWISSWFFCMVYAAQTSFNRARIFDFDNKTLETTSALEEVNLIDAFVKVQDLRQKSSMIHGTSNMYTAFKSFQNQANINNKSYVLILSDCRDWAGPKSGKKPLSADVLEEIARRAKRVIVLNPEARNKWNVVDSCVSYYEDAGADFFEVRNLSQLADLVMNI
ncbi:vWA domain-containing protein [Methanobacterium aggregans]|uniref:vWA domain-containing protein n=1 Tax=Methanobacterium aggregans TaxID=1615586 RepID=UPI00320F4954